MATLFENLQLFESTNDSIIKKLTYGNIELIQDRYFHNGEKERIILLIGSTRVYALAPLNDNKQAVEEFWSTCEDYINGVKSEDGVGMVSYYNYKLHHREVKEILIDTMKTFEDEIVQKFDYGK